MNCPKCGGACRFRGNFPPNDAEHWQCNACQYKWRIVDQNYRDLNLEKRTTPTQDAARSAPRPECDSSAPPGTDRR